MARPLPVLNARSVSQPASKRLGDVRLGVWIELTTILWMTIEASVAITLGFATRSVSLQGFGMDSIVELIAAGSCSGGCWLSSGAGLSSASSTPNGVPRG